MLALTFSVGPLHFAIPSRKVSQIVPLVPLRQVAGMGDEIAGLLELGDDVVPVVDLGVRLRGAACSRRLSTRIIVALTTVDGRNQPLGLIAENVTDLCATDDEAAPVAAGLQQSELGGVARLRGELLQWMDVDRILSEEHQARLYRGILAHT